MDWSVDLHLQHCAHPQGLSVFLDSAVHTDRQIRCLGPFGSEDLSDDLVRSLAKSLTLHLELTYAASRRIIVWGGYAETPRYREHRFPIMGSTCGFLPNPVFREELLIDNDFADATSPWTLRQNSLSHLMGIRVDLLDRTIDGSAVDPGFLIPECAEWQIRRLAKLGANRFLGIDLQDFRLDMDGLSWTESAPVLSVVR